jgi:virginiamycin B lyase
MLRVRTLLSIVALALTVRPSDAATGVFREQIIPGLPGGATQILPFGYTVWYFTEYDANRIGMLTRDGQFREFVLPTPDSGPRGIAVNSRDFSIWFTEFKAGKIGKLTRDGTLTEYAVPTPQSAPWGIAERDGNMWFTESAAGKIGRVNSDGSITEFAIPTKNAGPRGIVARAVLSGPCFAEFNVDQIGCLENGQFVERGVTPGSGPQEVFYDQDVRLWFTETSGNRIGAMNFNFANGLAQTRLEQYPIPTPASGLEGIVAECSGNVWFTEKSAGQIGFLSPDGGITEYPLADRSSQPTGITLSVFGAEFLESAPNRLVEIQPDAVVLPGGTSGSWETLLEVSNVGSQSASILAGVYPRGSCISFGSGPPGRGALLPANGAGEIALDSSVIRGLRTFYVKNTREGTLPVVRARIRNLDLPSQSGDIPLIRLSTLTSLNPVTLSFPGALRDGPARTNLLLAELSIERLVLDSPVPSVQTRVDVLGSDGTLLASGEFAVTSGTCLYLVDVIGRLGVESLKDGQIRVTKLGNQGLLWGYSARIDSDGVVSVSSGLNP